MLSVMRVDTLDQAIELINSNRFGNTTSIFTNNGKSAREFSHRIEVGMVGVNIGVAAPMAFFPFSVGRNLSSAICTPTVRMPWRSIPNRKSS